MNLAAAAIVLRPRTLAEVLDLACRLSTSIALGLYLRLAAAVLLPGFALCLALRHALGLPWPWVWAVAVALVNVAQGVYTVAVGRLLFSEGLGARAVLGLFARRLGSYLAALLASRVVLLLAALAFFIGLPFAWPRLLFVHEASLLEGARAGDALRRAQRFVAGRGARAFATLIALLAAQAGVVLATELLGQALVDQVLQLGQPFGSLFQHGGSAYALLGLFLSVPFAATARFLQYVDARTRDDGWDVQIRFMAIAARAGAARAA